MQNLKLESEKIPENSIIDNFLIEKSNIIQIATQSNCESRILVDLVTTKNESELYDMLYIHARYFDEYFCSLIDKNVFFVEKYETVNAAKQLSYPNEIIEQLKIAKNELELYNTMVTCRKKLLNDPNESIILKNQRLSEKKKRQRYQEYIKSI